MLFVHASLPEFCVYIPISGYIPYPISWLTQTPQPFSQTHILQTRITVREALTKLPGITEVFRELRELHKSVGDWKVFLGVCGSGLLHVVLKKNTKVFSGIPPYTQTHQQLCCYGTTRFFNSKVTSKAWVDEWVDALQHRWTGCCYFGNVHLQ